MVVLYVLLLVSALLIAYLIWSSGGFVKPAEPVTVLTAVPGFTFRDGRLEDVEAFVRLAAEPESMKRQGWDAGELDRAAATWTSLPLDVVQRLFLVAESDAGEVAGFTMVSGRKAAADQVSIGLFVGATYTGRGIGTGLMRVLILSLQTQGLDAWVGTATTNLGMQRIMERLGFSPQPEIEPYHAPNGETFESLWYQVGAGARPPR